MKTKLLLILICVLCGGWKFANVYTGQRTDALPTTISTAGNVTWNPTTNQLQAIGWRNVTVADTLTNGYIATAWTNIDLDGTNCEVAITASYDPVAAAAAAYSNRVAQITPLQWTCARDFKTTMEAYWGAGAETNRTYDLPYILGYFQYLRDAKIITAQQLSDVNSIQFDFAQLTTWTMDGTCWSFPYNLIPTNAP